MNTPHESHVVLVPLEGGREVCLMTRLIPESIQLDCPARYVVVQGSREVGLLEKYANTRDEEHPWKAFLGVGPGCKFIDAFYGTRGRACALAAIARLL
jgi:hypothetical protein